jgi:putative addiction module component (TIGR02574 family)
MAALNERLLSEVLSLSAGCRAELVEKILASLDLGSNKDIDALWEAEIKRRIEEVETGAVKLIPEEQVFDL